MNTDVRMSLRFILSDSLLWLEMCLMMATSDTKADFGRDGEGKREM